MYLVTMEQVTREQIAAAASAHRELGRDYDGPVAEGLVERIGAEIDQRVDNRLAAKEPGHRALWLGIGIGSAASGVTALIVSAMINGPVNDALSSNGGPGGRTWNIDGDMLIGLVSVWCLLVVIFIVHSRVRRDRRS
jgi:hypothetical protein